MFHKLCAVMAANKFLLSAYKPPNTIPRTNSGRNLWQLKWTQAKINAVSETALQGGIYLVKDGMRNPLKITCKQLPQMLL